MKTSPIQKIAKFGKSLVSGSANRRIFGAAAIVGLGTTLVKFVAVAKELVVAYIFGTSSDLDAFLIALIIPSVIITVIAGSFNSALIPTYIKVREREGIVSAQKLFTGTTVWSIGLLIVTTCVMLGAAPLYLPAITKGFSPAKVQLTYQLLWAISPMLLLTGIASIWGAVLNAGERFALVALAPVITSVVTVFFLLTFKSWGVFNLSAGLVVGQFIEMTIVGAVLHKQGMSLVPKWWGFNVHLKEVASQYAPSMVGAFLMCSTGLVDQSMAAMLPSGSVAALNYGNRIVSLPVLIASTAVGTVLMPYFSRLVASEDWHKLRQSLKQYLIIIFTASVPLTLVIVFFSEPIVTLLLHRGSFNLNDAQTVAQIQACFAFQIPFYIACMLVVRLVSAMRQNQILVWGSAGNLIVNISCNYLFMQWLGVAGIALSTSFVYLFSFVFLLVAILKKLKLTEDISLTAEQKAQLEQLQAAKRDRLAQILNEEQARKFNRIKESMTPRELSAIKLKLSRSQKLALVAIRQDNLQRFRSLLTPAQVAKIDRLQQAAIARVKEVLTIEQLEQFRIMKNPNHPSIKEWRSLKLTIEQKAAIKVIKKNTNSKFAKFNR